MIDSWWIQSDKGLTQFRGFVACPHICLSCSSLSPWTNRRPALTWVSDGNPFRRLLLRSKGGLVGVQLGVHDTPPGKVHSSYHGPCFSRDGRSLRPFAQAANRVQARSFARAAKFVPVPGLDWAKKTRSLPACRRRGALRVLSRISVKRRRAVQRRDQAADRVSNQPAWGPAVCMVRHL